MTYDPYSYETIEEGNKGKIGTCEIKSRHRGKQNVVRLTDYFTDLSICEQHTLHIRCLLLIESQFSQPSREKDIFLSCGVTRDHVRYNIVSSMQ